jgi:hypothetical protein
LSGKLAKRPRERFSRLVTGSHSDLDDGVVSKRELPRRAPHARELHVLVCAHAEVRGELAMEVVAREGGDRAQRVDRQRGLGMRVDMGEDAGESLLILLKCREHPRAGVHGAILRRTHRCRLMDVAVYR